MKISGRSRLKKYYQKKEVASEYIEKRFSVPIYSSEHDKQVLIINSLIKKAMPEKILEIAPGPARLTKEIKSTGIAIDNSESMLRIARKRMENSSFRWKFVKGDAFNLKFPKKSFDMVFTFRFIRHFDREDRKKIYRQVRNVLADGGYFVFEAPNRRKNRVVRRIVGEDKYNVYDFFTEEKEIVSELESNGFEVLQMIGTSKHFFTQVLISKISDFLKIGNVGKKLIKTFDKLHGENPLEWVIICRKK